MSFKKISAIFLIAVALMLSWNMSVFPEENTVSAEAAADKAIISQLGLFDFSDREDVPITRAEFAMAAYQIMCFGSQNAPVGRGDLYSDVGQWHWAAGYIEYLTERAVLNGVEPGVFDPDTPITVEQACKILLDLAGYSDYAVVKGGFPQGYLWIARVYGLHLPGNTADTMSADSFASLLRGWLDMNVLQVSGYGAETNSYEKGPCVYESLFRFQKAEGVLISAGSRSLDGREVGKDELFIGGELFRGDDVYAEDLLGRTVICYYDPDTRKISAIADNGKNKITIINSTDILSFGDGICRYYTNNKEKTVQLLAGVDIVVNGNRAPAGFVPEYGTVTLVDNNSDGRYEAVICEECQNFYVESIDLTNLVLYGKNLDENGLRIKLDLNMYESWDVLQQDQAAALEDIVPNSLLSVYAGTKYVRIFYNTKTVKGTITEQKSEDGIQSLVLNGTDTYKTAANGYFEIYETGSSVQAAIDRYGNIGAILKENAGEYALGYVIAASTEGTFSSVLKLKILKSSGDVEVFTCQEKINLNGDTVKENAFDSIKANLENQQLIRYQADGSTLKAIDTAVQKPISDNSLTETEEDALIERASISSVYYKRVVNVIKRYQQKEGDFDGEMAVSSDTVVFKVPEPGTSVDEDAFKVMPVSELPDNELTDSVVKLYTDAGDSLVAKAVVWINNSVNKVPDTSKMFLVDEIYEEYDLASGTYGYKISGLVNGEKNAYFVEEEKLLDQAFPGKRIEQGDVVRVYVGNAGTVTMIDPVYSKSVNSYPGEDPASKTKSWVTREYPVYGASFDVGLRIILGYEQYYSDGYMLFAFYDGASTPEVVKAASVPVYVYDAEARPGQRVYLGTIDDIDHAGRLGASCDTLIVNQSTSNVREIVVIKNGG